MTLKELLKQLRMQNAQDRLSFSTQHAVSVEGYHLTEFRASRSRGIDCSGAVSEWDEARVQILNDGSGDAITVGKFIGIAEHSMQVIPELDGPELVIEFGDGTEGLGLFHVDKPHRDGQELVVPLIGHQAVCKPAERGCGSRDSARCC